jgi:hypothetical protein
MVPRTVVNPFGVSVADSRQRDGVFAQDRAQKLERICSG